MSVWAGDRLPWSRTSSPPTGRIKYASPRPYADPEKAARRLIEIASTIEPNPGGRIYIERINGPFLFQDQARPEEYAAGIKMAVDRGWLLMHESGTFVRFTPAGAELFA
jgi:hypothetical protein